MGCRAGGILAIDGLIATFSGDLFSRRAGSGCDSELPVFIVGMPRSGTSLVEQILASHPQVSGQGELPHVNRLASELASTAGDSATGANFALPSDGEAARRSGERYVEAQRVSARGALRATDKMPTNFLYLGFIALILPRARVIHCRRDPRDTCLSCFVQNFGHNIEYTNDLADLAAYYRQYRRLMAH